MGEGGLATGTHAFVWQSSTGVIDLGDLPGGQDFSSAKAINNSGQVVGGSNSAAGASAFVWDSEQGMRDLNALLDSTGTGWHLTAARGINSFGQIVGEGTTPSGATHAYLLSPVSQAPIADAGGPYTINEGDSLSLDASASSDPEGAPLTFTWDVNGDGAFGDATGVAPTLT